MIDVCLLGCGGMLPLPHRALTSLYVRHEGHSLLIDCGEGTQIGIKEKDLLEKLSQKEINVRNIEFLKEMYV